ncbi:hypothetical protein DAPPUDRAFT_303870 [Daphnia pulex]|uniref:Beta-lactamase-like protein 2 homolog n=1 Tax=Daphnia pulex TaxID=6669 RepID=E9GIK5_DAPPU|nr:hypothetical protein DAPPUDRAFT_303870 [Daphnia pulex]|eukprot:EFX80676.1 hypothetical protein DAPPUDRAFT_303870 [Daphnia pulex]
MNILPRISQLSPRVIHILGCNPGPFTLQGTNTYLIGTGKRRILLDTGDGQVPEYFDLLQSVLKEQQATLDHILVSHWHPDHVGGVDKIQQSINKDCKVSKFHIEDRPTEFEKLTDGQEVSVEGANLKVYHTPGHSTDHIILHLKEENSLFSGDCILGEGTAVFEDLYDYMNSLKTILGLNPSKIYPGHGPAIEDPIQRIEYYIHHRNERERQILEYLSSNHGNKMSAMDIVKGIYENLDSSLYLAAERNVELHLKKLEKEGKVKKLAILWSTI